MTMLEKFSINHFMLLPSGRYAALHQPADQWCPLQRCSSISSRLSSRLLMISSEVSQCSLMGMPLVQTMARSQVHTRNGQEPMHQPHQPSRVIEPEVSLFWTTTDSQERQPYAVFGLKDNVVFGHFANTPGKIWKYVTGHLTKIQFSEKTVSQDGQTLTSAIFRRSSTRSLTTTCSRTGSCGPRNSSLGVWCLR